MQAKIKLAKEMNRRQGYLDGEDQKTLLSFVLYGDPLVDNQAYLAKSRRAIRPRELPKVKVVCDHQTGECYDLGIERETVRAVKKALREYLPGLDDAEVRFSQQITASDNVDAKMRNRELKENDKGSGSTGNIVMTVSKHYNVAERVHRHYARVTLNPQGKMLKIAVSR